MKKPKITKGEWHLGKRAGAEYGAIYGEKGEEIALPLGFFSTEEEARANAKCIAAAPAMAEALERALFLLEENLQNLCDMDREEDQEQIEKLDAEIQAVRATLTLAGYEF